MNCTLNLNHYHCIQTFNQASLNADRQTHTPLKGKKTAQFKWDVVHNRDVVHNHNVTQQNVTLLNKMVSYKKSLTGRPPIYRCCSLVIAFTWHGNLKNFIIFVAHSVWAETWEFLDSILNFLGRFNSYILSFVFFVRIWTVRTLEWTGMLKCFSLWIVE